MTITVDEINVGNRTFVLREQLSIESVYTSDEGWLLCCDALSIFGSGETEVEARQDFNAGFAICWDGLANEKNSDLTRDAQELKRTIKSFVRRVIGGNDAR